MRNKTDKDIIFLQDGDITVCTVDSSTKETLSALRRQNSHHHREWMVERAAPADKTRKTYAVFQNSTVVGEVSLRDFSSLTCQVAYWIDSAHWGQGIATTAVRLVTKHAFDDLHILEVLAYVHTLNDASVKVLERVGYIEEDIVNKKMFFTDNSAPHLMYTCDSILTR